MKSFFAMIARFAKKKNRIHDSHDNLVNNLENHDQDDFKKEIQEPNMFLNAVMGSADDLENDDQDQEEDLQETDIPLTAVDLFEDPDKSIEVVDSAIKQADTQDSFLKEALCTLVEEEEDIQEPDQPLTAVDSFEDSNKSIQVVVSALNQADTQDSVLEEALSTLVEITNNEGCADYTEAIEAVVSVLKKANVESGLLLAACEALRNMTTDIENIKAAGRAGAIEALVLLLQRKGIEDYLMEHAFGALRNITFRTVNHKKAGCDEAIPIIVSLFNRIDAEDSLLEEACATLRNLTVNAGIRKTAGNVGVIEAVTSVLKRSATDSLLEQACCTMYNLIQDADNLETAMKNRVSSVFLDIRCFARDECKHNLADLAFKTGHLIDNAQQKIRNREDVRNMREEETRRLAAATVCT